MAKLYGQLVGARKQGPRPAQTSSQHERGTDHVLVRDRIELAAAQINDTIQVAVLPWETLIDGVGSVFASDNLGLAACVLLLGDVTFPNALVNGTIVGGAALPATTMLKALDIANYFKPLWQMLGYATLAQAKAVAPQCELLFTVSGGVMTGTLVWQLRGQTR